MSAGEQPRHDVLSQTAAHTNEVVGKLRASITGGIGDQFDEVFGEHTTFMLTGSGGRGEMTNGSDIDGYVVRVDGSLDPIHGGRILEATQMALANLALPPLDREGEFLAMTTASALVDKLGSREDDHATPSRHVCSSSWRVVAKHCIRWRRAQAT